MITKINHVLFVGPDKYTEKKTAFRRNLTSHELIFHFSGQATVYFNDQVLETVPNVIRFLPQGTVSRYEVERTEPGSCIDIFFQTDKPIASEAFNYYAGEDSQLGALFKKLFSLWVCKEEGSYFECMGLLYRILARMQHRSYAPKKQSDLLRPAIDYINEHFLTEELPVEPLADLCGVSYSYLKKLFVKHLGLSPKQYILQLKMNYACDLLRTGRYTVSQTADHCGFQDVYYFSRRFKAQLGISPSQFVAKNKL